jgi:pimeloyl-ACP methyl ester carboxylesterase
LYRWLTRSSSTRGYLPAGFVIIDVGHFVWEEAPAEYAPAIIAAITGK